MGAITTFLANVAKYMALRERNSTIRILIELYNNDKEITKQIIDEESDINNNPDDAHIVQLYMEKGRITRLITVLENSEEIHNSRKD